MIKSSGNPLKKGFGAVISCSRPPKKHNMLRIFQTGDNHIGMKYASHEKGAVLSETRIDAFHDMVRAANENECGLFIITGDLFENTYGIAKKDVARILGILSGFRGTVAILPGNHDYYDPDSKLWRAVEDEIKKTDNILLLNDYKPYELSVGNETVVLYPAFCRTLHSAPDENNLGFIKEQNWTDDEKYRIGIAHGAVSGETIDSEGRYFLMSRKELEAIPVDVWLIGHTHVPFPKDLDDEFTVTSERIFNCGTHVQTDVSCRTEGLCFIFEIEKRENRVCVKAKKFRSGKLRFYRKKITLSDGKAEEILRQELRDIADHSVVELILNGSIGEEEYSRKNEIFESCLSRFTESRYDDCRLSRLISKQRIDSEFPETSFSALFLTELLDEPKQAQLAYDLIKALKDQNNQRR